MDKAVTRHVKRRYPLTTTDLTKPELRKLTEILTLENPPVYQIARADIPPRINETIKESIKQLPCALRRNKIVQMMPSHSKGRAADMCASHNGLNPYVVAHLLDLVKAEATQRLVALDRHAEEIHPFDRKLLRSIQAIGRIWGAEIPGDTTEPVIGAPSLQGNRCEVCMLARIATEPLFLRNLRIALLSRTRTKKKHRAPRLLRFIDGCIEYHEGYAFRVFHESNQLAIDFKLARKGTVAMSRKRRGRTFCQKSEGRSPTEQNTMSIVVYLDPELREQHIHDADEAGHASKGKGKTSDRDTLADDIIPFYEQISFNETRESKFENARSKDLKGAQPTKPSLFKKDLDQISKSKQTLAGNIPSREKQDWAKVMERNKSPLSSLARKLESTGGEGLGFSDREDADALETGYCDLLSPRMMYDSESEYSQALSEDDPIQEPSPHGTTWSLVMKDAET